MKKAIIVRLVAWLSAYLVLLSAAYSQSPSERQEKPTLLASLDTNPAQGNGTDHEKNRALSETFKLIDEIAIRLQLDPEALRKVIAFETVSTFDPSIRNPRSGAVGLIQFTEIAASEIGTTTDALARMSAKQQLVYVEKYLARHLNKVKRPVDLLDLYLAVFAPAYIGAKDGQAIYSEKADKKAYLQNIELDLDLDGSIRKAELAEVLSRQGTNGETRFTGVSFFDVIVNGQKTNKNVIIEATEQGAILLLKSDFKKLGFRDLGSDINKDGEVYIDLSELKDGVYKFDTEKYQFNIRAPIDWYNPTNKDYFSNGQSKPAETISAFVSNYRADVKLNKGGKQLTLAQQNSYYHRKFIMDFGTIVRTDNRRAKVDRTYTRILKELPDRDVMLTLGDAFTGPLANQTYGFEFFGLRYASDRHLDPFYNPYRSYGFSDTLNGLSDVSVLLNGELIDSFEAGPGELTLSNLPVTSGDGSITIIIEGEDGRYYAKSIPVSRYKQFFKKGTYDYDYNAGIVRKNVSTYDNFFVSSTHQYSITDEWDVAGTFLAARNEQLLALTSGFGISRMIYLEPFGSIGLRDKSPFFSIGASVGLLQPDEDWNFSANFSYASSGGRLSIAEDSWSGADDVLAAGFSADRDLGPYGSISAYGKLSKDETGLDWFAGASWRKSLSDYITASLQTFFNDQNYALMAGLNVSLGESRGRISGRTQLSDDAVRTKLRYDNSFRNENSVWNNSSVAVDVGRVDRPDELSDKSKLDELNGQILKRSNYGLHGIAVSTNEQDSHLRLTTSGSIGATANQVFASQPITGPSGVVMPIEGVEIDVKKSNVVVGRLDGKSPLIVPRLSALRSNKLEVEISELPEEYSLEESILNITPPRRGMVPIRFAVKKANPKTFVIVLPDGAYPPPGSILTIEETNQQVVVAYDGEAYLADFKEPTTFILATGSKVCRKSVAANDQDLKIGSFEKVVLACQMRDR